MEAKRNIMIAARDLIFHREIFADLGIRVESPSRMYCDSKSAVDLTLDPVAFKHTKHILRAAEFLRDLVARDVITVSHVPGAIKIADICTKACARVIFVALLRLLDRFAIDGVVSFESRARVLDGSATV